MEEGVKIIVFYVIQPLFVDLRDRENRLSVIRVTAMGVQLQTANSRHIAVVIVGLYDIEPNIVVLITVYLW